MFTSLPIEDLVLLTLILIEAAIVIFILLRFGGTIGVAVRKLRRASFFSCVLAFFVLAVIAAIHLRDDYLGLDDDPPPVELGSTSTNDGEQNEGTNFADIAGILAKVGL